MKVLPQKLTREEASELCQAISILEQTRPRMIELLKPQIPLSEIPLAHELGGFFLDGKLLVMDSEKLLYTVCGIRACRDGTGPPHHTGYAVTTFVGGKL